MSAGVVLLARSEAAEVSVTKRAATPEEPATK
jgi:hypothetical protein